MTNDLTEAGIELGKVYNRFFLNHNLKRFEKHGLIVWLVRFVKI